MHLDYLKEFIILAKYMNISKAARELNMTHSNLSKHVRQLEIELRVELITHGPKVGLTSAGLHFLDCATNVVNYLENVRRECQDIAKENVGAFIIRQPTYSDAGLAIFYEYLDKFRMKFPEVPVKFEWEKYAYPETMITSGDIDAHIIYLRDSSKDVNERFAHSGLTAYKLCDEQLGVWLPVDHPLGKKPNILIEDLAELPILETNQVFHPLGEVIQDIFRAHGLQPNIDCRTINSFAEMLTFSTPTAIRLFPLSIINDMQIQIRSSMCLLPVGTENDHFSSFLLMRDKETAKTSSLLFQEAFNGLEVDNHSANSMSLLGI